VSCLLLNFGARSAKDITNALDEADCIVIATDHNTFKKLNLEETKRLMHPRPLVVDGKRIIDPQDAKVHGFTYYAVGLGMR